MEKNMMADLTDQEIQDFLKSTHTIAKNLTHELNPWAIRRWTNNELLLKETMREILISRGANLDCGLPVLAIDSFASLPYIEAYKRSQKLTLESDIDYVAGNMKFELVPFAEQGEITIPGSILLKRAQELNAYCGQRHGEALLANQLVIPWEWRRDDIVLPGTIFKNKFGHNEILLLRTFGRSGWGITSWQVRSHFLSHYRLLRATKI